MLLNCIIETIQMTDTFLKGRIKPAGSMLVIPGLDIDSIAK
jgi:hypothetical protein